MNRVRILGLLACGLAIGLVGLSLVTTAQAPPPGEPETRPLDRFERFTVTNSTGGVIVLKELEFRRPEGPINADGFAIPPGTWEIMPAGGQTINEVVFQYGVPGAERWFNIKGGSSAILSTASVVVSGPATADVAVEGQHIRVTSAIVGMNLTTKP